jgi:PAS domain S-box-containing protein
LQTVIVRQVAEALEATVCDAKLPSRASGNRGAGRHVRPAGCYFKATFRCLLIQKPIISYIYINLHLGDSLKTERMSKLNILILEDNPADAKLAELALTEGGIRCQSMVVGTKEEFISAIESSSFDFVLADHSLPGFNSIEALSIVREKFPHLPFILVTGTVSEEFAAHIILLGADDYILKFNISRLPHAVKAAMAKHKMLQEKEAAIERLRQSEYRNKSLVQAIPDLLLLVDKKGTFLDYKAAEADDFLTPLHKVEGKKITDIMPADLARQMMEKVRAVYFARNVETLEYTVSSHGLSNYYEARFAPFNSDKVLVVIREVTQERRTQLAIEAERNLRETLLQSIDVGIFTIDTSQTLTAVNAVAKEMLGIDADSLPYMELFEHFTIYTSDGKTKVPPKQTPLFRALKNQVVTNVELIFESKQDGSRRNVIINAQPIYDSDDKMTGAVSACHDITTLKTIEERLRNKVHELDTFIYRTAHDLRGPLASILGLVEVARREVKEENAFSLLDKFKETAEKLDNILNDLFSVTKITRGKINFTKIHLDTLVPALLKRIHKQEGSEEVKFNLNIPSRHQFLSDRYLIRSILQNIFENSMQYRKPDAQNTEITISVMDIKDYVRIQVIDNGQGIPEDLQEKIFDMFYKGNYASTGTGLGLYISRVAVEKLGGSIAVSSNYGEGTTISIHLPALNDSQVDALLSQKTI